MSLAFSVSRNPLHPGISKSLPLAWLLGSLARYFIRGIHSFGELRRTSFVISLLRNTPAMYVGLRFLCSFERFRFILLLENSLTISLCDILPLDQPLPQH